MSDVLLFQDRESVLHAQYREFLRHAAQQSFYAVPSHSNGDGPVVRVSQLDPCIRPIIIVTCL